MGDKRKMTEEEIKNKISEHKECCKKLAEEYRQRYNEDNTDKLALNMFYHNVISYNDFETILATVEDRNSMIMCFSAPPVLTEETVEIDLKRIAELEKENAELKNKLEHRNCLDCSNHSSRLRMRTLELEKECTKAKEIIKDLLGSENTSCEEEMFFEIRQKAEQFINSEVEKCGQ